jgi:hypothetical protein
MIRPDNRLFVEAILPVQTGIPWRDLPGRFGYWRSTHQRVQHARQRRISLKRPAAAIRDRPRQVGDSAGARCWRGLKA